MPVLIDSILLLEQQANDIVASAQADAKAVAVRAESDVSDARKRLVAETDARLAAFSAETDERQKRELADVASELRASLAAIDGISPSTIQQFAARVADAFQRE